MRVCLDATPLDTAHRHRGIGRFVQGLVDALAGAPFPIVQLRRSWAPASPKNLMEVRRAWRPPKPGVRLQWLWNELRLPGEVRATGCHVFHATDPQGLTPGRGYATIATAYDLAHLRFPREYYDGASVDTRLGLRRMEANYRRADHLIAISEATKREFVELLGIPPERISVVYPGFDPARFAPGEASATHGIPVPEHFFLYVGAADPRKNLRGMLEAFALVKERVPESFVLAGKLPPAEATAVTGWIAALGLGERVVLPGYLPDPVLGALYRAATAFVFPSHYEGFGLPILEAMGCSCPVITSTQSCLPEIAGDAAVTVHPDDTEALADALRRVSEDESLREQLRARGKARVAQFSWQRCAAETLKVYEHVAGRE